MAFNVSSKYVSHAFINDFSLVNLQFVTALIQDSSTSSLSTFAGTKHLCAISPDRSAQIPVRRASSRPSAPACRFLGSQSFCASISLLSCFARQRLSGRWRLRAERWWGLRSVRSVRWWRWAQFLLLPQRVWSLAGRTDEKRCPVNSELPPFTAFTAASLIFTPDATELAFLTKLPGSSQCNA